MLAMETVVETSAYLSAAKDAGMSAAEMAAAVDLLSANPLAGALMVGTGGCRKVRLAGKGKGKSGGYRLITFYRVGDRVFLLTVFAKGDRANLTRAERNALKALTEDL
ncbi:type II toxin-antitoxin system RelE/ParE family toxin [Caulobacter sp. LARHSG274]